MHMHNLKTQLQAVLGCPDCPKLQGRESIDRRRRGRVLVLQGHSLERGSWRWGTECKKGKCKDFGRERHG